jgi:uncharacterized protein YlzI (FlbEa/FlbD family)
MTKLYLAMIAMVITFLAGLGLGYALYGKETKVVEKDKPAIVMHDTSVVLKRVTDTVLITKLEKVPGTKTLHNGTIEVVPNKTDTVIDTIRLRGDTIEIIKTVGCDTINLTYAILQEKDGGVRVQVKAEGGKIIGGVDIPRDKMIVGKPQLKNTLYLMGDFAPRDGSFTVGGGYDRTFGCFRIGPYVTTVVKDWQDVSIGVRAGLDF